MSEIESLAQDAACWNKEKRFQPTGGQKLVGMQVPPGTIY